MFKKQSEGTTEESLKTEVVKTPDYSTDYRESLGQKQKNRR
jgi:hypothetical protein